MVKIGSPAGQRAAGAWICTALAALLAACESEAPDRGTPSGAARSDLAASGSAREEAARLPVDGGGESEPPSGDEDPSVADGTDDSVRVERFVERGQVEGVLPELSPGELPPLTRAKPDPAALQYVREPVFVDFRETIVNAAGETRNPEPSLVEEYLAEYLRRAGHPVVSTKADAEYVVEGALDAGFHTTLRFRGEAIAERVHGEAHLRVSSASGEELETFEIPSTLQDHSDGEDAAFRDLERYLAKLLWEKLSREGTTFSNSEVLLLIDSLAVGNILDWDEPTAEKVIEALADVGFDAVPYLIEALTDTRTVQLPSSYPGLESGEPQDLRVFHVADKALEEIFQKVSRLDLRTPPPQRFVVLRGWENEWRRFCKPYRESPAS